MNSKKTVCFSGHRKIDRYKLSFIMGRVKIEIEDLIKQGADTFISGGAVGFDTIAATLVLSLKETMYPHIKLIFAIPCRDHDRYWNDGQKELFASLFADADEVVYASEKYYKGCMHERNRWMVDRSGVCLCYLEQATGGTAYTVDYAKAKGLAIRNIAKGR